MKRDLNFCQRDEFSTVAIQMGGQTSNLLYRGQKFDRSEWTTIATQQDYKVIASSRSNEQAQLYILNAKDKVQQSNIKDVLELRRKNQLKGWVTLLGYSTDQNPGLCATTFPFEVYTQCMPMTFNRVSHLEEEKALQYLELILDNFDELRIFCGRQFNITQRMIGLNSEQQVKVWCSEKFAETGPVNAMVSMSQYAREEAEHCMVMSCLQIVQSKLTGKTYPQDLIQQFRSRPRNIKLSEAKDFVSRYREKMFDLKPRLLSFQSRSPAIEEFVMVDEAPIQQLTSASPPSSQRQPIYIPTLKLVKERPLLQPSQIQLAPSQTKSIILPIQRVSYGTQKIIEKPVTVPPMMAFSETVTNLKKLTPVQPSKQNSYQTRQIQSQLPAPVRQPRLSLNSDFVGVQHVNTQVFNKLTSINQPPAPSTSPFRPSPQPVSSRLYPASKIMQQFQGSRVHLYADLDINKEGSQLQPVVNPLQMGKQTKSRIVYSNTVLPEPKASPRVRPPLQKLKILKHASLNAGD